MAISSAKPANMEKFVAQATPASAAMASQVAALKNQISSYVAMPSDYRFTNGDALGGQAATYISQNQADERFVTTVRQAFVDADATTLSNSQIAGALGKAGVSAAPRQAITINQPSFQGKPLDSGFSDDPVCTATGHFLEIETDLVLPGPLRVLACTRTYSSRFLASTSLGRGWYGWADASLTSSDAGVDYTGPDGQIATFGADGDAIAQHPEVEAVIERRPGGLRMRWRWASRFGAMTWDFAPDGRLEAIVDPFGGTTTCSHDDDGRLVAMTHQGGRQVVVVWDGTRVAGLRSSDGRTVTYRYVGDDLVGVERPGGAQTYAVDDAGHIVEVVDADGVRLIANTYDDEGRVLAQTSPFGRTTRYAYLAPRTVVVGDDEGGPSTLFRHDVAGRLVELRSANGTVSTRSFDTAGNAVQVVDFDGGSTDRAFDINGNCVYERQADGSKRQWRYDDTGRVVSHTGPMDAETHYSYQGGATWPSAVDEPLGQRTTYESSDGLPTRMTDADGVTVEIERDDDGVVVALTNA
ncbi:MAG: DUF6531 domain-containing protein, partial [Actinomycetota bacterium]|nr:DUF6531 domain-containing protein [Actinomycetota bacterium]